MASFRPANDENDAVLIFFLRVILDIFNFFFYHYIFPVIFFSYLNNVNYYKMSHI